MWQGEDFKQQGQAILGKFKAWVEGGAGGASGWQMEAENHEGWRVAIEEVREHLERHHDHALKAP